MLFLPSSDKLNVMDVQLDKDLSFGEIIKKDVVQVFYDVALGCLVIYLYSDLK